MRTLELRDLRTRDVEGSEELEFDGIAVPYDAEITYGGIRESFAAGAFDTAQAVGTPLLWAHDRAEPVGHITEAVDTPVGLMVTGRVLPTNRGKDAITLMRAGSLRGLSVGFEPTEREQTPTGITYTRAILHELSLTPLPAYGDAVVTATREEAPMSEQTREAAPTVDLAPITERIDQLEARMLARREEKPQRILGVVEAFTRQLEASRDSRQLRALADVISSGNAGVLPPAWSSEVVGFVDSMRYMFPRTGSMGFPATGHTLTIPKITQHTTVAARGTEKTEIPSQALTTGSTTYTAEWAAGGADVSLEVIWQSDPSIWGLVVEDLLAQYAAHSDQALTLALETAATATGAVLDFTDYGTFVGQVIAEAETIRAATGAPGNMLSLTTASWQSLVGLVDADGRRILSTSGATNADGSAGLTSTQVDVGGITCFHNPRAAEDLQYNTKSARSAEKPPVTITSDNVALAGRDVGVLGAYIVLPVYLAGLRLFSAAAATQSGGGKK